jgi:hypothetical protein
MARSASKAVIIADTAMLLAFSLALAARIYIESSRGAFPSDGSLTYSALFLVCLSLGGGILLEARRSRFAAWVNLGLPCVLLFVISFSLARIFGSSAVARQSTLLPAAVALSAPWLLLLLINGFAYWRR